MALPIKSTSKNYEIRAHTPKTTCLDIGATGRVLVTGGQDRFIKLWTFGNQESIMTLKGHTTNVDLVKFAYNDDFVFSADENGIIKRWDLNSGNTSATLYGHMKSVRALDSHPYGDYIVSGSNDTTLRLWDIRVDSCIKRYRAHISHINSVKFSPDGTWIASAGNEGSLIIWDIRMSKAICDFTEHTSSIECIQYHPFEFLLAAGRADGTVDFYDLERKIMISSRENRRPHIRQAVKCVAFSEGGECLFAGTPDSLAVIGWEPDTEYDHVKSTWTNLGDMKVLEKQILCGAYENDTVSLHAMNIALLMPFFDPTSLPFSHNQGSRKSFSNRTGKLRLSYGNTSKLNVTSTTEEENEQNYMSADGQSSPNLSIEMIDDDPMDHVVNYPLNKSETFDKKTKNNSDSLQIDKYMKTHTTNGKSDKYHNYINDYAASDLDYYPVRSSPHLNNVVEPEREDFPVNSAQPPDYAPKINHPLTTVTKTIVRQKVDVRRAASITSTNSSSHRIQAVHGGLAGNKKILSSTSTSDLHKIDDNQNVTVRKPVSRNGSPVRSFNATNNHQTTKLKKSESITQFNRDSKTKNIPVHIITKPQPVARSKTNIDLRAAAAAGTGGGSGNNTPSKIPNYVSDLANEHHEIQLMTTCHESVFQALRNRHTSLQIIRTMRSSDSNGIIKNAVQMNDHGVLVDIIGAITEKSIPLNLDSCVTLLPEIYELLRSEYKFHNIRACDILRSILTTFLPTIQANIDPYGPARSLGVDITREERQYKCLKCREWLLRIRGLPENDKLGTTFTQLQNMITEL